MRPGTDLTGRSRAVSKQQVFEHALILNPNISSLEMSDNSRLEIFETRIIVCCRPRRRPARGPAGGSSTACQPSHATLSRTLPETSAPARIAEGLAATADHRDLLCVLPN